MKLLGGFWFRCGSNHSKTIRGYDPICNSIQRMKKQWPSLRVEQVLGVMKKFHTQVVLAQRWDLTPASRLTIYICLN